MSERVSGEGDGVAASLFLRCVGCEMYGVWTTGLWYQDYRAMRFMI